MRIDVIPIAALSEKMRQRWLEIQAANPKLAGPCFHPDLFIAVGKFSPNIHVALIYEKDILTGFFPYFKNEGSSIAEPIDFCDYQTIIGPRFRHWNAEMILKKTGLKSWAFNALVNYENINSRNEQIDTFGAMRVDLRKGYGKYLSAKKEVEVHFDGLVRKKRALEANFGPLQFVPMVNNTEVLYQMMSWKKLRHDRDPVWTKLATDIVEHFCNSKETAVRGVLSALYAGNDLLAVYFGIRYDRILHSLICSFNPNFEKFSPGLIIWQNLIAEHRKLQYNILDLGPSDYKYKRYFSNCGRLVIKGSFTEVTLKEEIKSIPWLYHSLRPIVQVVKKVVIPSMTGSII